MCFFLTSTFIALATPAGWLYEPETPAETDSELPGRQLDSICSTTWLGS
jgi:hypothetical protein